MTFQIVKLVSTPQGEIAYLLDDATGRVMKTRVEDFGNVSGPNTEVDIPIHTPAPVYRPQQYQQPAAPFVPNQPAPVQPLMPRPKSIIPREVRQMMIPSGNPGAHTEVRNV